MSENRTPTFETTPKALTTEHLDKIEAFLADTLGRRSFPTFQGIEGWEWRAMLDAARRGLAATSHQQAAWLAGASAERKRCEMLAERAACIPGDCDHLGGMDPETGARECSIEIRTGSCPCEDEAEAASTLRDAIRALPEPTPPEPPHG